MRTTSFRRHQMARIKLRRKHYFRVHDSANERLVGVIGHTPQLCSCYGCGNPRKFGEQTIQERRANEVDPFEDEGDLSD